MAEGVFRQIVVRVALTTITPGVGVPAWQKINVRFAKEWPGTQTPP